MTGRSERRNQLRTKLRQRLPRISLILRDLLQRIVRLLRQNLHIANVRVRLTLLRRHCLLILLGR